MPCLLQGHLRILDHLAWLVHGVVNLRLLEHNWLSGHEIPLDNNLFCVCVVSTQILVHFLFIRFGVHMRHGLDRLQLVLVILRTQKAWVRLNLAEQRPALLAAYEGVEPAIMHRLDPGLVGALKLFCDRILIYVGLYLFVLMFCMVTAYLWFFLRLPVCLVRLYFINAIMYP